MILSALRLLRSLTGYHYRTILLTTLLPVIGPPIIACFGPDLLVLQVILYVAAFIVWSVFAVLAVSSMLNRDRSEAEHLVAQRIDALSGQIGGLREEHEDLRVDIRQGLDNLEEAVRSTLKEELGVVLRPRTVSLRTRASGGEASGSLDLNVTGGSKIARLRQWFQRVMRRLREVVYGRREDS